MNRLHFPSASARFLPVVATLAAWLSLPELGYTASSAFVVGDPVKVTRSEMLAFQGKNLAGAAKGQEFTLLKHDAAKKQVFVSFMKEDTLIAVALPEDAVEPAAPHAALDLVRGTEAFRDQRYDEAKRLLTRAAQDYYAVLGVAKTATQDEIRTAFRNLAPTHQPDVARDKKMAEANEVLSDPEKRKRYDESGSNYATLGGALFTRVNGAILAATQARANATAKQAATNALQVLRDTAEGLAKAGLPSLALPLDEGADRLGAQVPGLTLAATKMDRADLTKRVTISQRSFLLARQAMALKQLVTASKHIKAGLDAEPAHPMLKVMLPLAQKDIEEADSLCKTAKKMQRQPNGAIHALSAIDDGLKLCTDHVALRELRKDLAAAFEERTSPQVTPAFLSLAKVSTPTPMLEEGRKLYTARCTECHDLEMLDGRSLTGWERMVSGMARRANLNDAEKTRIMDYIAAAQKTVEAGGVK